MTAYPAHEALAKHQESFNDIAEFWAYACESLDIRELHGDYVDPARFLYLWFGVDPDDLEAERKQMLRDIKEQHA